MGFIVRLLRRILLGPVDPALSPDPEPPADDPAMLEAAFMAESRKPEILRDPAWIDEVLDRRLALEREQAS